MAPVSSSPRPGATRRELVLWPLAAGLGGCASAAPAPPALASAASLKQAFGRAMPIGSAVTPEQLGGPEAAFIDIAFRAAAQADPAALLFYNDDESASR